MKNSPVLPVFDEATQAKIDAANATRYMRTPQSLGGNNYKPNSPVNTMPLQRNTSDMQAQAMMQTNYSKNRGMLSKQPKKDAGIVHANDTIGNAINTVSGTVSEMPNVMRNAMQGIGIGNAQYPGYDASKDYANWPTYTHQPTGFEGPLPQAQEQATTQKQPAPPKQFQDDPNAFDPAKQNLALTNLNTGGTYNPVSRSGQVAPTGTAYLPNDFTRTQYGQDANKNFAMEGNVSNEFKNVGMNDGMVDQKFMKEYQQRSNYLPDNHPKQIARRQEAEAVAQRYKDFNEQQRLNQLPTFGDNMVDRDKGKLMNEAIANRNTAIANQNTAAKNQAEQQRLAQDPKNIMNSIVSDPGFQQMKAQIDNAKTPDEKQRLIEMATNKLQFDYNALVSYLDSISNPQNSIL